MCGGKQLNSGEYIDQWTAISSATTKTTVNAFNNGKKNWQKKKWERKKERITFVFFLYKLSDYFFFFSFFFLFFFLPFPSYFSFVFLSFKFTMADFCQ